MMLSLNLLGPSQITLDGRSLSFRTNKVQALLCYLAVEAVDQPGLAYRREALMALLWPDMPLKSAQDNLRQTLYQLRKAVPETAVKGSPAPQPFIHSDRLTIQINPTAAYKLDTADFQSLVTSGAAQSELEKAAALYRGDFLADFYLPDSSSFEDWAAARRVELRNQALEALDKVTTGLTEKGRFDKAALYARRQLEIDNLRESAYRQLMTILWENGRRPEALQQYESCRRLLLDELGVEPAAETMALYQQIRSGSVPRPPPRPVTRRLPRHNLPAQTTSFVGRQQELADVIRLLKEPDCRLLTLLGPGGIGKTRLSLQVASFLAHKEETLFPDGVFMVPLAAVPTMEQLVPATSEAIGFSFSGPREPRKQLLAYLKSKQLLLVLDNLEHLVGEAALLVEFLSAAAGLTFLVTSRARLNLYEEWHFELKGLEVPAEERSDERQAADLANYSAVQLFLQRARQAGLNVSQESELPIIGQICHLLAGIPLGIELAAGWVRTHTCTQIAAEIERNLDFLTTSIQNVPERHRSLHVTFEQSWRLLPAAAQQIFARTTVFRGGFDQEAAEFVTGASRTLLAGLVDNSMLQVGDGRFQMNELLRQFGAEKLAGDDAADSQERLARYYAAYLAQREQCRWTVEEPSALNEIGVELKNILSGWQWTISCLTDPARQDTTLELTGQYTPMLAYFYDQRNRYHEGVSLFQQAAAKMAAAGMALTTSPNQVSLAKIQAAEAEMRFHLGQFSEVEKLLKGSLAAFRQSDSFQETAAALARLGTTYNRLGVYQEANRYLQESLTLFRQMGAKIAGAEALNGLGIVAISEENFDKAQQLLQESLTIYRETGYQRGIARALSNLGTVNVRSGNYEGVLPLYEEALVAARTINDVMVIAVVTSNLGSISRILGNFDDSLRYYEESLAIFREMDERRWIAADLNGLGETLLDMGQLDQAEQRLYEALEISTIIQSVPDILDSLAALGQIAAGPGSQEQAVAVSSFVVQHPVTKPLARARSERLLTKLKEDMPVDVWRSAQARGENESIESLTAEFNNPTWPKY